MKSHCMRENCNYDCRRSLVITYCNFQELKSAEDISIDIAAALSRMGYNRQSHALRKQQSMH